MDIKSTNLNYNVQLSTGDMTEAVRLLLNLRYGQNIPDNAAMSFRERTEGDFDTPVGFDVNISAPVSESRIKACLGG